MSREAHTAPTDELRIVLLGKPGSGKSTTGNVILGKKVFHFGFPGITEWCVQGDAKRFGKRVSVVDTPAVFVDTPDVFDTRIQKEIKHCIWLSSPGPHAIILCVPIGYFTIQDFDIINNFVSHFDEALMKYVIIVFTKLDVWKRDEEYKGRESNGNIDGFIDSLTECPRNFLQRCKNRFIAFDNTLKEKEAEQQVQKLISIIENMVQENGGTHYSNDDYAKTENILQEKNAEEKQQKEKEMIELQEKIRKETDAKLRKEYDLREKQLKDQLENIRLQTRRNHYACTIL